MEFEPLSFAPLQAAGSPFVAGEPRPAPACTPGTMRRIRTCSSLSLPLFLRAVFPTDRDHSVRVFDVTIPVRWTAPSSAPLPPPSFAGVAHAGEAYFFQLGLWAYGGPVANLTASAGTGLTGPGAATVPLTFMNLEGFDFLGNAFNKTLSLASDAVGSLWVWADVPAAATPGVYSGVIELTSAGSGSAVPVTVNLTVDDVSVPFGGADNITSLTRLSWYVDRWWKAPS